MPKTKISKYTFSQLEELIQQAKREKNKFNLVKYKSLAKEKEKNWAKSLTKALSAGRQKHLENQQFKQYQKLAREQDQQAKLLAKQSKKTRLQEIYSYYFKNLNKEERSKSPYFTAHLDLEPSLAKELARKQKQVPEYDFYAEFKKNKKHLTYKLNKQGQTHLLQQTRKAYNEEIAEQKSQIRYYQEKAGFTKVNPNKIILKQKIKLFFPEKGEHQDFVKRKKEFKTIWQKILKNKPDKIRTPEISKLLYEKSPLRIRDRNLQSLQQKGNLYYFKGKDDDIVVLKEKPPSSEWSIKDIFKKYYKENPFEYTKKHYRSAITEVLRKGNQSQEVVSEEEIELDRYNQPILKKGQAFSINSNKPGKKWTVYKKAIDWQKIEKEQIHEVAHQGYLEEYGTALEIQTWKQKKNKALCWVEAMGLGSCADNQGTSNWFCLECIIYGEYHPPVLPKHCTWEYTYRRDICSGSQKHSDANKQFHFSIQGERTRDAVEGGDWGSCHIGVYGQIQREKSRRKKYTRR